MVTEMEGILGLSGSFVRDEIREGATLARKYDVRDDFKVSETSDDHVQVLSIRTMGREWYV